MGQFSVEKPVAPGSVLSGNQHKDGEFWRSPRKVGVFSSKETPFSNDHFLGVWAYIAHKKDHVAFKKWIDWIDGQPYPRLCQDKDCILGISDCPMLDTLALLLLESNKVCDLQHKIVDVAAATVKDAEKRFNDAIAELYKVPGSEVLRPVVEPLKATFVGSLEVLRTTTLKVEEIRIQAETYARALSGEASLVVGINSLVNKAGPGQWDAAVEILLLKKYAGVNMPGFAEVAGTLTVKQPKNAFFEYVAHGPTDRMLSLILEKCPAPENDPPHARFQWQWERADDEQPPPSRLTMYWDCLTVANLYKDGPAYNHAALTLPDLSGAANAANTAADSASAAVDSIISTIVKLLDDCKKLNSKCVGSLLTAPLVRIKADAAHALDQLSQGQVPTPIGIPTIASLPIPGIPPATKPGPIPENPLDPGPRIINQGIRRIFPHW
jgi:hypothetical protein